MVGVYAGGTDIVKQRGTRRLTRDDWLAAALSMVAETGVERLRVQALAASLGATTGSLYWHFQDRRALTTALLEYWEVQSTERIAAQLQAFSGAPEAQLLQLMKLVKENAATSGDVAIRSFAAHEPDAAVVVARADKLRASVVGGIFRAMGFRGDEAAMRTQLFLCYESCERFVSHERSRAQQARLLRRRHALYCRR